MLDLRLCCNHPYLLGPEVEAGQNAAKGILSKDDVLKLLVAGSGKLALLDKMVAKLVAAGHRVLLYSQFCIMLNIMEDWLQWRGWGYQRIDGSVGKHNSSSVAPDACFLSASSLP